jgi:hypothetical protein
MILILTSAPTFFRALPYFAASALSVVFLRMICLPENRAAVFFASVFNSFASCALTVSAANPSTIPPLKTMA